MAFASLMIASNLVTMKASAFENYNVDRFADIDVLRYEVSDFNKLSLQQKKYVYYLTEAALYGRDILTDQNSKYNLQIRTTLELIYKNYKGDKNDADYKAFLTYLKRVWFANGIHHHYSKDKFTPNFSEKFFDAQIKALNAKELPTQGFKSAKEFIATIKKVIFDPTFMAKGVNQETGKDLILTSANNYYDGVNQKEVEDFYASITDPNDLTPISYGLNSKLVKENGKVVEKVYKVGGLYGPAIEKIIYWLGKAKEVAENDLQKAYTQKLIDYYTTGELKTFDEYSILWSKETEGTVDYINGFIENYGDPLGYKGAWESIVNFKNHAASERTRIISENAQWFEDHSPIDPRFKKKNVTGVSAKVITAAILAGDSYPATPIGINLPNSTWIRAAHGSKSVTIENITDAYNIVSANGGLKDEFAYSQAEIELMKNYLALSDKLHTDLHECLGHGSGQILPGVSTSALKENSSTIEESRADLFALYYMADDKMLELGIFKHPDTYKAAYYQYILNGLMTQLSRIELGKDVEEAHMRNRKLIAEWAYEHGKANNVIEFAKRDGKTFIRVNDYVALRNLFGELLAEIQRITSTGDYQAGVELVNKYAVKIDPTLHKEVRQRYDALNIPPYKGFVNPIYTPVYDKQGNITDVTLDYTEGYIDQMLRYSRDYSPLTK